MFSQGIVYAAAFLVVTRDALKGRVGRLCGLMILGRSGEAEKGILPWRLRSGMSFVSMHSWISLRV